MYRTLAIVLEDGSTLTCSGPPELAIHEGDLCIADHGKVLEFGRVQHIEEHPEAPKPGTAVALRRATLQDQSKAKENSVVGRMAFKSALKKIDELRLPIHLIQLRYSFDRSVLSITYTSEDRVECHELARALGAELHTRLDMRQIGVRDAARLVGGLGPCGRMLCCHSWLNDFEGVSVKMAKTQRMPLNPSTIGGMCGRLKCCLRYEFDCYKRMSEHLPKDGARVRCPEGVGQVLDKDIMAQRVKVRLEDGRVLDFEADQVKTVSNGKETPEA
jgi:cell fate regulator YaaT (PSP1 superfamily)